MIVKTFESYWNNDRTFDNRPKIYLAGGWSGWRDIVIEHFPNVNFLDPRKATKKDDWFDIETQMVRECDGIIAWVVRDNKSGFGMTYEMGMAYGLNKPYVLINEKEDKYTWSMQSSGSDYTHESYINVFEWIHKNDWLGLGKYYKRT